MLVQDRIHQLAAIPLLTKSYLAQSDLSRCVRVSHTWHSAFIPHLWHTFAEGVRSQWTSRIQQALRQSHGGDNNGDISDDGRDVEWYLDVYRRHAKYIRRLSVNHPLILEALLEGGLRVPPSLLASQSSPSSRSSSSSQSPPSSSSSPVLPEEGKEGKEKEELSLVKQLEHVEIFILWSTIRRYFRYRPIPGVRGTHSSDGQNDSVYSDAEEDTTPIITTVNNTNDSNGADTDKDMDKEKNRSTTTTAVGQPTICTTDDVIGEALWRLLLSNPNIKTLDLRQDFLFFRQLLHQSPTALQCIQSVTTQLVQGRLPVLPPKTLKVEANNVRFSRYSCEDSPGPVNNSVEEVVVRHVEHLDQLRQILFQAPKLKKLYIENLALLDTTIVHEEGYDDGSEKALEKQKEAELEAEAERTATVSGVQVVRCNHLHRQSTAGLERLFRMTPHLVEFYNSGWTPGYASILAENCPLLEVVRITSPRYATFLERNPKNPIVDTVSPLLTSCSKLRVVDIRYELVDAKKVKEKLWVCLGLEKLRCQFVGVPYLTEKEQVTMDRMLAREKMEKEQESEDNQHRPSMPLQRTMPTARSKEEEELHERTRQATEIRRQVLGQLSKLTRLKHLTLSPDLKITDFSNADMYALIYRSKRDGQHYINYGDVRPDTLHLRLDCGLDQLATLTDLEYLAMESMDPQMRAEDVEWIAKHLGKLKEMRGLALDTHVGMEDDPEKDALRGLLQSLRPDILHTESPGRH